MENGVGSRPSGSDDASPPVHAPCLRLRRVNRLRNRRDFARVDRTGRRRVGDAFVVQSAPSRTPSGLALGLVVGRKVGNAVVRNRVKRQIREWFRNSQGDLARGRDLVVVARKAAAELDARAIRGQLDALVLA